MQDSRNNNISDEEVTPTAEENTPVEEENVPTAEENIPAEESATPTAEENIPAEESATPTAEEAELFSEETCPKGARTITTGGVFIIAAVSAILTAMICYLGFTVSFNAKKDQLYFKYNEAFASLNDYSELVSKLLEVDQLYDAYYPGEVDEEELFRYLAMGYIAGAGDLYGHYYDPEEAALFMSENQGESSGIGITVIEDRDTGLVRVVSVYKDSPAEAAGMAVGDLIAYVTTPEGELLQVDVIGYEAALANLRGESGTDAVFSVFRDPDGDGVYDNVDFTVTRAPIEMESVKYRVHSEDSTVGVISIYEFNGKTPEQFIGAVEALKAEGVSSLVFDVRYNPGGDRDAVCAVLDYLLPEGPLMRTVDKEGNYTVIATSDASCIDMPMAVITNGSSASAAELFTAALKDYGVAVHVGETTYGKGTMQGFFHLFGDGSLLKLTTAYYCPPYSGNYDGEGIVPDVAVEPSEALKNSSIYTVSDEDDNQLAAAVEALGAAAE